MHKQKHLLMTTYFMVYNYFSKQEHNEITIKTNHNKGNTTNNITILSWDEETK